MAVHGYDAVALDHQANRFGFVYPGNKVEQNSTSYKMSNKQQNVLSNPNNNGLSRLEQLRMGYQERLLHEKEQKLSQLFQTQTANSRRNKSKSGGTVRQFFAERRALENSHYARKNPECLPPIQHHFDKVKQQRTGDQSDSPQRPNHTTGQSRGDYKSVSAPAASVRRHTYQRAKPRVGIDRQNPLPSLKASNKKEPVYSHYETETTLINNDQKEPGQITISPHPPVNSRKSNGTYRRPYNQQSPISNVDDLKLESDQIVPEKLTKVKMLRAKRLSQTAAGPSPPAREDSRKLTDFQKWQMEQDEERRQRLEKHRERQDSENSDDLSYSQQERELIEKIRAEKEKLREIQKEQKDLDEEKRREKEEEEEWLRSQRELERVAAQMEKERERMEKEKEQMERDRKQMEKDKKQMEKERKKKELEKSRKAKSVKEKRAVVESPITKTENNNNTGEDDASVDPATENYFKNFYEEQAAALAEEEVQVELAECSNCGRKFAADRLAKHTNVCIKSSQKKRKVFDNRKMRMQGTDMEEYLGKKDLGEPVKPIKKSNWRAQHENFVQTIRYAKGQSTEAPPPAQNPDYVQCPHCNRKFNEAAAERHIPRCKDIKAKPTFLKRKK